ncbi:MAG: hypothetical protein ACFHXK_18565 [bacterium]
MVTVTTYMLRSSKRRALIVRYDQQPLVFSSRFAAWRYKRKLGKAHWEIVAQRSEQHQPYSDQPLAT